MIDYGAVVDGYCSDMTRTICTGTPTELQQRMIDVVMTAQQAGVDAVKDGRTGVEVDRACRDVIGAAGWADAFSHGTGHGVGLEIHEDPRVTFASAATLAAGHVVTVEPGVYLPEQGGVRIEDTLVVTLTAPGRSHTHRRTGICTHGPHHQRPEERHDPQPPEGLFQVVEFQHVKPGKGGAFVRTTLKNVRTGAVVDRTFRGGEKVEQAMIDRREMQYLYRDGSDFVFMDNQSYDQLHVAPTALGDSANYIVDGSTVQLAMYDSEIVGVELPAAVELTVTETEPGIQGDVCRAPQAGHVGDRARATGTAVRQHRRPPQGRHSQRRLHHASVSNEGRRAARERALELLYEAEAKDTTAGAIVDELPVVPDAYACVLAVGVDEHSAEIDALLTKYAKGWALDRMPAVDRALLRLATYELLHHPEVPVAVVISEAVELASQFSTDDSSRFVNGVLSAIAKRDD